MSSYQYYDFYAIDQPLTPAQREEINSYSSRSTPSARQASFAYHYGDFKHDPKKVLLKHFDMALYASSYGHFQLMIKLPADLVDFKALRAYEIEGEGSFDAHVLIERHAQGVLVDLDYTWEEYGDWLEAEGWLDGMLSLRAQLLKGDYRLLYLAWLHVADTCLPEDADWEEPPLPPGLDSLDAALQAFVSFWAIDEALIEAAAKNSPSLAEQPDFSRYLTQLSDEEKNQFLAACLAEESSVGLQLQKRLRAFMPDEDRPQADRRGLAELRKHRDGGGTETGRSSSAQG